MSARYQNRSMEEFEIRKLVACFGKSLWPEARLVHELMVTPAHRIDMAFVGVDFIVGFEIKSSGDTLARAYSQVPVFRCYLSRVVLVVAAVLSEEAIKAFGVDSVLTFQPGEPGCAARLLHPMERGPELDPDRSITAQMLRLLSQSELHAIARRRGIVTGRRGGFARSAEPIALRLTGRELLLECCHQIRIRDAFPKTGVHPPSDPPALPAAAIGGVA